MRSRPRPARTPAVGAGRAAIIVASRAKTQRALFHSNAAVDAAPTAPARPAVMMAVVVAAVTALTVTPAAQKGSAFVSLSLIHI